MSRVASFNAFLPLKSNRSIFALEICRVHRKTASNWIPSLDCRDCETCKNRSREREREAPAAKLVLYRLPRAHIGLAKRGRVYFCRWHKVLKRIMRILETRFYVSGFGYLFTVYRNGRSAVRESLPLQWPMQLLFIVHRAILRSKVVFF